MASATGFFVVFQVEESAPASLAIRHCEPPGPVFGKPEDRLRQAIRERQSSTPLDCCVTDTPLNDDSRRLSLIERALTP
ncbi:hypothetical protein BOSE46_10111 [Bosea sp. 46]|nr:hypothetical protein BOSE46_10111 [Bosea sp. 46]